MARRVMLDGPDTIHAVGGGWGGDGLQGDKVTTAADMMARSGLGFTVEARPVFTAEGKQIPNFKAITRTDTGKVFQVSSDHYGILQPGQMFDTLDAVVKTGGLHYTSGGALGGGAVIFATVRLPQEIRIGREDRILPYLAGFNSYDGSSAAVIKGLTYRPICRNTALAALRTETIDGVSVRHTLNVAARLRSAAETLQAAQQTFKRLGEQFQAMARARFTDSEMQTMVENLIPATPDKETGEIPAQSRNARETLQVLFTEGHGQREYADIRGTRWAAWCAVTEYVDHLRPTRVRAAPSIEEARLASAWLGSGAQMKERARLYLQEGL